MWSIMTVSRGSRAVLSMPPNAGGSSAAQQQRVAAGPAGLGIAARAHVGDAVVQPFVARQVLDHHRARPQRLRRIPEKARQHAVLETLDVDLQRIDMVD